MLIHSMRVCVVKCSVGAFKVARSWFGWETSGVFDGGWVGGSGRTRGRINVLESRNVGRRRRIRRLRLNYGIVERLCCHNKIRVYIKAQC